MKNLREVKDDLLKEWLEFLEETAFSEMTPQDKKYCIYFEEIAERILKNVPNKIKDTFKNNLINLRKTLWIIYITGTRSIIEMVLWMWLSC